MTPDMTETEQNLTHLFDMIRQTFNACTPDAAEKLLDQTIKSSEKKIANILMNKLRYSYSRHAGSKPDFDSLQAKLDTLGGNEHENLNDLKNLRIRMMEYIKHVQIRQIGILAVC